MGGREKDKCKSKKDVSKDYKGFICLLVGLLVGLLVFLIFFWGFFLCVTLYFAYSIVWYRASDKDVFIYEYKDLFKFNCVVYTI